jgi:hypothetical protein
MNLEKILIQYTFILSYYIKEFVMNSNSFSSKSSSLFKTKIFSLSSLLLCSFFVVGCGSSDDEACIPSSTDICTAEQFKNAARNNLSGEYKLLANIDLSDYPNWTPIGNHSAPFAGKLDGNGKTIKGLRFQNTNNGAQYIGLFGYINSAQITNLKVQVANSADTINLTQDDDQYFGIIAGYANGANLTKIAVSSTATTTLTVYKNATGNLYAGGIAGATNGTLINKSTSSVAFNVINNATIPAAANAGGIVGLNNDGVIGNSYTTGNISANGNNPTYAGGIAGWNYGSRATISNSYTSGAILANDIDEAYAGGIAGVNSDGTISASVVLNTRIMANAKSTRYTRRIAYGDNFQNNFQNNFALSTITLRQNGEDYVLSGTAYDNDGGNKTLSDLQTQATYKSDLGWDFTDIWDWSSKRPVLR